MIKRREFITLIGGAAAWPVAARAQQPTGMRRVGVLMGIAKTDVGAAGRIASIEKPLQEMGWVSGRNIELMYRWGAGDADLTGAYAKELVAARPDLIFAHIRDGK